MKRLLPCVALLACGHPAPAPAPGSAATPAAPIASPAATPIAASVPAPTPEARAQAIVDALAKQDFDAVEKTFSPAVAAGLPTPQLTDVWQKLQTQAGVFGTCDAPERKSAKPGEPTVVAVPCHFAKATLDLVIALDDKLEVVGLHFVPHQGAVSWSPPPYAATDATTRELAVADLPGTLTVPAGKGPAPCVVLVHGSGPNDRDETIGPNKVFADLATGLAAHGIATLRYEKRTRAKPQTLPKEFTVDDEVTKDAVIAAQLCATQPEIDHARVFVLGHSLGAMMAPRIAQRAKDLAGILVLAGPTRDFAEIYVEQITYIANADGTVSPDEQKQIDDAKADATRIHELMKGAAPTPFEMHIGAPASYWKDLATYDATKVAASLTLPIFVGQGGRDYQVSATKDFPAWQKALAKNTRAKLVVWPALTHVLMAGQGPSTPAEYQKTGHVDGQVIEDLAAFVDNKPTPTPKR